MNAFLPELYDICVVDLVLFDAKEINDGMGLRRGYRVPLTRLVVSFRSGRNRQFPQGNIEGRARRTAVSAVQ